MTPSPGDRAELEALLAGLRQAVAGDEHRLIRSGKESGLFGAKTGAAADRAVRDGLLKVTRTEARGKSEAQWVRITPAGVAFLHAHESPRAVLGELRSLLEANESGLPGWVAEVHGRLNDLADELRRQTEEFRQQLASLHRRVDEALRRVEAGAPVPPDGVADSVPWAADAMEHLDRRGEVGASRCPLPELFAALRGHRPDLSLSEFHLGVRRLADAGVVRLEVFAGRPDQLAEPEFALLDGSQVLYFVSR